MQVLASPDNSNMPARTDFAFIPELGSPVALLIGKPFQLVLDQRITVSCFSIYWITEAADERGNLQRKWTKSLVEASTRNTDAHGKGFDHVCVLWGRVVFYDFIRDSSGDHILPFWHKPSWRQPKLSIVKCSRGAVTIFWCRGTTEAIVADLLERERNVRRRVSS